MMQSDDIVLKLKKEQVKYLMSILKYDDPNKAIDFMIELMILEDIDPIEMKKYMLKMMEKELKGDKNGL
jgi:hypothetical protein